MGGAKDERARLDRERSRIRAEQVAEKKRIAEEQETERKRQADTLAQERQGQAGARASRSSRGASRFGSVLTGLFSGRSILG